MAIHLRQRGGIWHARGTIYADGEKIVVPEFSTRYRDRAEAERFVAEWERDRLARALAEQRTRKRRADVFRETGASDVLPSWAAAIWKKAKRNAAQRGIYFDLGEADMAALVARAGGRCEVSWLPFDVSRIGDATRRPYAPSIDRIRSRQGYVLGNCRLVCAAVNYAMNEWGEEVLIRIARAVARRHRNRKDVAQIVPSPLDRNSSGTVHEWPEMVR